MTHVTSLSNQTWCHFLTWTLVLLFALTSKQYCRIYQRFEWIFWSCGAGKERSALIYADGSGWPCHAALSTFVCRATASIVTSLVPQCTSGQRSKRAPYEVTMGFAVRVRSAGQKYGPTCHQRDRADVTEFVTLVRLLSLGQHVGVLALAGFKRRKCALTADPIVLMEGY